jgi:hypothetical protein
MRKRTTILLSTLTIAGIGVILLGNLILTGDATGALTTFGSGISALAGVLLVENYWRRYELKKAAAHRDKTL